MEQPDCVDWCDHRCLKPGCGGEYQECFASSARLEYQIREENLEVQKQKELERKADLEERKVYVQTKQYIEEVAKEKLGLVNPDEILLKPSND